MKIATKRERSEQLKRNEQKWSRVLMDAGWTVLPSVILEKQHALGLDAVDVNILLHLARHWWYSDNLPHPSKATIARCIGIDVRTVQRRIAKMESVGFIRREARYSGATGRQETNRYHFQGLIENATPFARELIQERHKQRAEADARRRRKKPRFALVPTGSEDNG